MTPFKIASADDIDINRAIRKFNGIKPHIKNDFFELDMFFSRIICKSVIYKNFFSSPSMHKHSFYELHIPITGEATCLINKEKISISPKDALLLSPYMAHRLVDFSENYSALTLGFNFVEPKTLANENFTDIGFSKISISDYIHNNVFYILNTLCKDAFGYNYVLNNQISIIMFDLLMQVKAFADVFVENSTGLNLNPYSDDGRIRLAIQYITDNISSPITVNEVAEYVSISTRQLNRILNNALGITTHELIDEIKLKAAKRYMSTTRLSLTQIAALCGFNSPIHFNITFKRYMNVSPKTYRANDMTADFVEE